MTDQEITNALAQAWQRESNGRDCLIFLGPRARFDGYMGQPGQAMPLNDPKIRFVTTNEDGVRLDLEIHETGDAQQIFINAVGDQSRLQALPLARSAGNYRLPDRIFFPGDDFKATYDNTPVADGYSLYTAICAGLKPRSIFEIGIRYGYSAWAMLRGCDPGTIYHGIDVRHWEYADQMLHQEYPQHELRLARADSGMLTHLARAYDLVHVDGNHSHEGALHDLGLAWGHARYIMVDDVLAFATVGSAVNEFLGLHPDIIGCRYDTQTGHVLFGPLPLREEADA